MTNFNIGIDKDGKLAVGRSVATVEVAGVQSADIALDWDTHKISHFQDTTKTTIIRLR
jgi:hypothetical protein